MFALLIIMVLCTTAVFIWMWVKFVNWLVPPKPKENNPYIEYEMLVRKNDKWYDEYLRLKSKTGGVPVPKIKTPEEMEAERKIEKAMGR